MKDRALSRDYILQMNMIRQLFYWPSNIVRKSIRSLLPLFD